MLSLQSKLWFVNFPDQIVFQKKGIDLFCDSAPHHNDLAPAYFENKLIVKPTGWHKLQTLKELKNALESSNA